MGRVSCAVERPLASQVGNCFIEVFLKVKCGLRMWFYDMAIINSNQRTATRISLP